MLAYAPSVVMGLALLHKMVGCQPFFILYTTTLYSTLQQPVLVKLSAVDTMATSHPSFVVVPGAWHQPEAYEKLVTSLRKAGYSAVVISLPSCNAQNPQKATCSADAEAVRKQILHSMDADGKYIVIVCHSYGGIPGGGAAFGLSKTARARQGKKGGVTGLVYVAGFVVPETSSLLDIMGGKHAQYLDPIQVPILRPLTCSEISVDWLICDVSSPRKDSV